MTENNNSNIDFTVYGFDTPPVQSETLPKQSEESDIYYNTAEKKEEEKAEQTDGTENFENTPYYYPLTLQKPKKSKKNAVLAVTVAACVVFSFGAGFLGTYFANKLNSSVTSGNNTKVVYQSVVRTDQNGDTTDNLSIAEVAAIAADSVVEITTEVMTTGSRLRQYVSEGAGSGVIVTADGYIATNNHVINGASKITVRLKNGKQYTAMLVGTDVKTDLAVIKINEAGLQPAVFGSSSKLSVGETAVAIGNPLGELGGTVTNGIISALDREISIDGETMTLLQTNAEINPGNSGGGLFNSKGELIGIVNAKSSGSDVEGLGFAIPIDTAKSIIKELIENGYVTGRIDLGLELVDVSDATTAMMYRVSRTGVYISKVTNSSLNLKVGDLIYSIDGKEITSNTDITEILNKHKVGDTLSVVVIRNNKQVSVSLTLSEYVPSTNNSNSIS